MIGVSRRHGVKVRPGPRDPGPQGPGPPQSLKVGPQDPLQSLKVGSQDPLKVGPLTFIS